MLNLCTCKRKQETTHNEGNISSICKMSSLKLRIFITYKTDSASITYSGQSTTMSLSLKKTYSCILQQARTSFAKVFWTFASWNMSERIYQHIQVPRFRRLGRSNNLQIEESNISRLGVSKIRPNQARREAWWLITPYPLIRPYFWGHGIEGGTPSDSHDVDFKFLRFITYYAGSVPPLSPLSHPPSCNLAASEACVSRRVWGSAVLQGGKEFCYTPSIKNWVTLPPIIMEVENGSLLYSFPFIWGNFPLPWLWEKG